MVSTLQIPSASNFDINTLPLSQIIPVPVSKLKFKSNSRYGWEEDKILDAYLPGISELKDLIYYGGFSISHPVEAYVDGEDLIPIDGNRRTLATKMLMEEDPDTEVIDGYPGCIYVVIVPPPDSISRMMLEQSLSNASVASTDLDIAKVWATRFQEITSTGVKETEAIKQLVKELEARLGKDKTPSPSALRQAIKLFDLPTPVLDWLQASLLDVALIKISKKMLSDMVRVYGNKPNQSHKLLLAASELVKTNAKEIETKNGTFQNFIKAEWLDALAVDLDIPVINAAGVRSNAAAKNSTAAPASANTEAQTKSASSNAQDAGTEDDASASENSSLDAATNASSVTTPAANTDNGATAPTATRNRRPTTKESAAAGILKVFGTTDLGLHIAEDRYDSALIVENPTGVKTYTLQIEGLSQEMVADWDRLKEHVKAYLGDQGSTENTPADASTATTTVEVANNGEEIETEF